eukprot:CAMPEP_0170856062 /NCGR_PEP_ID=MMETSP0734-20130129/14336_1 /TAXON_ID=186038 /ORGANISM="Fragilariopsis kerguelensis, Strain L26-C5" /LENGTH=34 /DNA_ID= /DNA_START= /DNA_END= /DNA_ORIENTATION=
MKKNESFQAKYLQLTIRGIKVSRMSNFQKKMLRK